MRVLLLTLCIVALNTARLTDGKLLLGLTPQTTVEKLSTLFVGTSLWVLEDFFLEFAGTLLGSALAGTCWAFIEYGNAFVLVSVEGLLTDHTVFAMCLSNSGEGITLSLAQVWVCLETCGVTVTALLK